MLSLLASSSAAMAIEEVPCNHDFLDPNTTIVVRPTERETWCISCSKSRKLLVLDGPSKQAALAAKTGMLFGGGSRGNN